MREELLEISDVIVDFDPHTLARLPVSRDAAVARLVERGQRRAARQVARIPVDAEGVLRSDAVDVLLCRAHAEIQLLSEETLQGERVWKVIEPVLRHLREEAEETRPINVVDVGCGLGYVSRYLAAHHAHPDVCYLGVDFNRALVGAADWLAREDELGTRCRFEVANAFTMQTPAHLYTSTGVIHHFRGQGLRDFFAAQFARPELRAMIHFDIQPNWASPFGAWLFHKARFKEALGRHDGVVSAQRAHSGRALYEAARAACPERYVVALLDSEQNALLPPLRIMHAVLATTPDMLERWRQQLGARRFRVVSP